MKNSIPAFTVLLAIVLGCANAQDGSKSEATVETKAPAASTPQPAQKKEEISSLTWSDYDRVYNVKSNSTDMQKEQLWKNFEGKAVSWTGIVEEVKEGMLGGLTLFVKMNSDTLTHDIMVKLKSDQKQKAGKLVKGNQVAFVGKLESYGGTVLPLTIGDGEIR